ncbi:unnamed protein product, partial [Trichogramma brassicae]
MRDCGIGVNLEGEDNIAATNRRFMYNEGLMTLVRDALRAVASKIRITPAQTPLTSGTVSQTAYAEKELVDIQPTRTNRYCDGSVRATTSYKMDPVIESQAEVMLLTRYMTPPDNAKVESEEELKKDVHEKEEVHAPKKDLILEYFSKDKILEKIQIHLSKFCQIFQRSFRAIKLYSHCLDATQEEKQQSTTIITDQYMSLNLYKYLRVHYVVCTDSSRNYADSKNEKSCLTAGQQDDLRKLIEKLNNFQYFSSERYFYTAFLTKKTSL